MRASVASALLIALAAAVPAAESVPLPDPDRSALETTVAEQLGEMRTWAAERLGDPRTTVAERAEAWGELGRNYHAYGLLAAADACYAQAAALDPESGQWPYYRGHVAVSLGDAAAAAAHFARSLERQPDDVATLVHLADVESVRGRGAEARELLERAAALPTAEPVVWARLGELAVAEGRYQDAIQLLTAVLAEVPQATRLHHALGLAYRGLGDLEAARRHLALRGEVGLAPSDPLMEQLQTLQVGERVHLLRGRAAFQAGSLHAAAEEFAQAVAAKPDSARARINLSAALAGLDDPGGAMRELRAAIALEPDNPTARYNLALLLAAAGEHSQAVEHFAAATALQPHDEAAWLAEAESWIAMGDFARATVRLSAAASALPDSGTVAYALARLLAAAPDRTVRDGARAAELAARVFEVRGTVDSGILVSLALREQGRCLEAARFLDGLVEHALSIGSEDAVSTLRQERARFSDAAPCRP